MDLKTKIFNRKTQHEEGFTRQEIDELLREYPDITRGKFNKALGNITCLVRDGETIIYHIDIVNALRCGLENRDLKFWEWD